MASPDYTTSPGEIIYDHGRVIAEPGRGRFISGRTPITMHWRAL